MPEPGPREGEGYGGGSGASRTPGVPAAAPGGQASAPAAGVSAGGGETAASLVPVVTAPRGQAQLVYESPVQFRYVIDRFEGVNLKQAPLEIGELQAVTLQNALTDETTLRKRTGASTVGTGSAGTVYHNGLHEVAHTRDLLLEACDAAASWTPSDAVNFTVTDDTTIKVEGTGAIRLNASGVGAEGDTVLRDFGAGALKDLRQFDYVELMVRATGLGANATCYFGISEDNATYQEVALTKDANTFYAVRLDITAVAAASRDGIRYLRFRYDDAGGAVAIIYADTIRAKRVSRALIRGTVTSGIPTGGVRDFATTMTMQVDTNRAAGAWAAMSVLTTTTLGAVPASTKMRAVSWLGQVYMMFGEGGAFRFQEGVQDAAGGVDSAEVKTWPEAPPSRFLELHYEKLWAWSQPWDRHALRHTNTNSSTVWPTATAPIGGDGGLIYVGREYEFAPTGMRSYLGHMGLWTEGDLWILFGSDNSNFALQRAHPGAGTLSNESIAKFDTGVMWHDGMHDRILVWSGGNVLDISDPIRPQLEAIPAALKPWTAGLFTGRYYLFSYASSGATENDRCCAYDLLLQRWHGPWAGDWVGFNTGLLGADGAIYIAKSKSTITAGGVRQILSGTSDSTAAIALAYKTGDLNARLPRWLKRIRRAWVKASSTTATLTLRFYLNLSGTAVRTYTLTGTGAAFETLSTGVHNDVRGDVIQAEITESSTNAVTLHEVGFDGHLVRAQR